MKERRSDLLGLILAVVLMASLWSSLMQEDLALRPRAPRPVSAHRAEVPTPTPVPDSTSAIMRSHRDPADRPAIAAVPPGEAGQSPMAEELNAAGRTGADDLKVVMSLLGEYRKRFDGYPVGEENAAFVNALAGNNPLRLAFIDRAHPAIDSQGQLCDRWGVPLFFHPISRDAMEVRGAGPDGRMYTPDDLLEASPSLKAQILSASRQ